MDKEVRDILVRYGVPKASIDALSGELIKANCIIYKVGGAGGIAVAGTYDKLAVAITAVV